MHSDDSETNTRYLNTGATNTNEINASNNHSADIGNHSQTIRTVCIVADTRERTITTRLTTNKVTPDQKLAENHKAITAATMAGKQDE